MNLNYWKSLKAFDKLYLIVLLLVPATLFFYKENVNSISIILLSVIWLFNKEKHLYRLPDLKSLVVFIVFFTFTLYGLVISENKDYALKIIQRYLPFLIFPLVFNTIRHREIDYDYVKIGFITFTIIGSIYCQVNNLIYWSWVNSFSTNDFSFFQYFTHHWFTYGELTKSIDLQPSFFSLYIILASIFLIEFTIDKKVKKGITLSMLLYLTVFIIQLSSKIGVLAYVLLLVYYFFKIDFKIKRQFKVIIFLFFAICVSVFLFKSRFSDRIVELVDVFKVSNDPGDNSDNVKKLRVYALRAFAEQPIEKIIFGQGTGDSQKYLDDYYEKNLINEDTEKEVIWKLKGLHYHNQFVQVFADTGVFGFICLILLFYYLFKENKKKGHYLFLVACLLFFLADSMLIRHKALVFFVFFNLIYITDKNRNETFIHNN